MSEKGSTFAPAMAQKETKPGSLKWWLQLAVAIISAIIGMLVEGGAHVASSLFNL